jgi:hypothetical protein
LRYAAGANHRLHRRWRDVMSVDDEAGEQGIRRELLPNDIRVARQDLRAAVAEVRGHGRPGGDRIADLRGGRIRVSDGDAHAVADQPLDQRQRAPDLRRDRDQHDAPRRGVLAPREVVEAGRGRVLARVRAPRAVFRRDVRPLHVQSGDSLVPHGGQHARARGEPLERRGDEGGQAARDARGAHACQRFRHAVGRQVRRVEVDSAKAVHLQVEKTGELDPHRAVRSESTPGRRACTRETRSFPAAARPR